MARFNVVVVVDECIGCGACTAECPDNWENFEKDGMFKARPKNKEVDDLGCNMSAAEICPVNCIHITDETGKKLI